MSRRNDTNFTSLFEIKHNTKIYPELQKGTGHVYNYM